MRIFDVDEIPAAEHGELGIPLLAGEAVEQAFRADGTTIIFTDRRIVTAQIQVLLTERLETTSYSYRALRHFSLTAGVAGEGRTELRIWLGQEQQPLHFRANPGADFSGLQMFLAARLD